MALTICSMLVTLIIAIPMGVIAAWKVGTWIDRLVMAFAVIGFSFPTFVIAYMLVLGLSMWARPVAGAGLRQHHQWILASSVPHIIMPSLTLGIVFVALIARMTRASMLDVLSQDYIRTAQSKGLSTSKVLIGHALKNAAVPDRDNHRPRHRAADQWRRGDGNRVCNSGPWATDRGRDPASRLSGNPGRRAGVLGELRGGQSADRHQLHVP